MSDKEILRINEKYTIVLDQDVTFKFYATRNGESWRDLTGDNLILAMFQLLQTAKEENEKLNKLHAFLHNKFNWSKEDVWIRNYLSSYIFDEEMVSDGKEYISPLKQILDLTQQNKQMREHFKTLKNHCKEWSWVQTFIDEILKGGE